MEQCELEVVHINVFNLASNVLDLAKSVVCDIGLR